jgi:uncharacterized protein (TIGR04255 family)
MGKYQNPPIREAILDIRVAARRDLVLDELRSLLAEKVPEFPKIEEQFMLNWSWTTGASCW